MFYNFLRSAGHNIETSKSTARYLADQYMVEYNHLERPLMYGDKGKVPENFEDLKSCNDPSGNVPRSHIVPFALAQGGNITVENLYGEIVDIIKKDGYLQ